MGDKACMKCKDDQLGISRHLLDEKVEFTAEKSYIPLSIEEKQQYNELRVRDLSVQELCIGRILIHSFLMMIMIFSDSHVDIDIMKLVGVYDRPSEYQVNVRNTLNYLSKCLDYDWGTLKKLWCVNEEKVLQVIQSVIIGVVKDYEKFHVESLKTHDMRKKMEGHFKDIINKILSDKNTFFRDGVDPANQIELVLMELKKNEDSQLVAPDSIDNLLRLKIKVTLKQFELHLKDQ